MSLFDLFLLLCILIVSAYTYTKRNVMIIETYRRRPNTNSVSKTEKRLKALESIVGSHTRAIKTIRNTVKYLSTVIGFKESDNKKTLFERIIVMEEELSDEEDGGDVEFQLPEA
jgi:hypothetical protein